MSMHELEKELIENVDESYFEMEDTFNVFDKLVHIFSTDVNEEEDNKEKGGIEDIEGSSEHPELYAVQKQVELCTRVMEVITHEHQASLINSVQEMGVVCEHYIEMRKCITEMRNEIAESKLLLLSCRQLDKERQLFHSKIQNANVLDLMNAMELVRDAPMKFDKLISEKRFVSAVNLLNTSLHHVFSMDLMDVEAVGRVAFDLVERKGFVLDNLVSELTKVIFHDTTTTKEDGGRPQERTTTDRGFTRGGNSSQRVESHIYSSSTNYFSISTSLEITDSVDEDTENGLKDPSTEGCLYIRLLVEAIFRLDAIHDAERHLMERIKEGIECLTAGNMRACGAVLSDLRNQEDIPIESSSQSMESDPFASFLHRTGNSSEYGLSRFINFLRVSYRSFIGVIRNSVRLAHLIQCQEQRRANKEAEASTPTMNGVAVHAEIIPLRHDLIRGLWAETQSSSGSGFVCVPQENLIFVIQRHILNDIPQKTRMSSFNFFANKIPKNEGGGLKQQFSFDGLYGHGVEFNHTTAAHLHLRVKDAWLCKPTPLAVSSIYRETKEFVNAIMAILHELEGQKLAPQKYKDEKVRMTGNKAAAAAAASSELPTLDDFINQAVKDVLIPELMSDSNGLSARLAADSEAFLPYGGGGTGGAPLGERAISKGALSPGKATVIVYEQILPIFRAMAYIDEFRPSISSAMVISLENFCSVARKKLEEEVCTVHAYKAYVQSKDQFHEILHQDEAFLQYKASQYGKLLRLLPIMKKKNVAAINTTDKHTFSGKMLNINFQNMNIEADVVAKKRVFLKRASQCLSSSPQICEIEYRLLKELKLSPSESTLFRMNRPRAFSGEESRPALLDSGKLRVIACIALSCDWLASRAIHMCQHLEARSSKQQDLSGGGVVVNTSVRDEEDSSNSQCETKVKGLCEAQTETASKICEGGTSSVLETSNEQPFKQIKDVAGELSSLSNECLLILRLNTCYAVIKYLSQLKFEENPEEFGRIVEKPGSTSDEICVAKLCRVLQSLEQTFLPVEHEQEEDSIPVKQLFAYVIATLPRLIPHVIMASLTENATTTVAETHGRKKVLFQTFCGICIRVNDTLSDALGNSPSRILEQKCSKIMSSTSLPKMPPQSSSPKQDDA